MSGFYQLSMKRFHSAENYMDLTVVGSPTINNGIVSDFSSTKFLKTSNIFSSLENTEYVFKCKFSSVSGIIRPAGYDSDGTSSGLLVNNGVFGLLIGRDTNNTIHQITTTYSVSTDIWYWIKVVHTTNNVVLSVSTDGINFSDIGNKNVNVSSIILTLDILCIGGDGGYNGTTSYRFMSGEIDIPNCYLIQNGTKYIFTLL